MHCIFILDQTTPKDLAVKRCCICFSAFGPGLPHSCNSSSLVSNITECLFNSPSKVQSQVISTMIKHQLDEKLEDNSTASCSKLLLSQTNGQPLPVTVGKNAIVQSSKKLRLSTDDMLTIKSDCNLSDRTVIKIASSLRVATNNRKIVECGLKEKLTSTSHSVDNFFSSKKFVFVNVKEKQVSDASTNVVYCTDVPAFIAHINEQRQSSNSHLKLGIDGGGGFLKICLSVQSKNNTETQETNRSTFAEGVAAKKFQDSSVKKLFILGIAPNSQENYQNVAQLWSELNINSFSGTIATDLKLANILVGVMSHSSSYPCTWCYAKKDELQIPNIAENLRTFANVMANYEAWDVAGASKDKAKKFYNCIHRPLVTNGDANQPFLEIIPPPELHLMLGVVNTLFTHMMKECETESLSWAKSCYAQREITHGSPAFKGNSCKKLLDNIDILRGKQNLALLKYVKAFDDFKKVVSACFGKDLDQNYTECIEDFKESYLSLGVSVTPKVHAVFFHIGQFCKLHGIGLGFFSEQAMESVHFDFKSFWEKNKVAENHPDYAKKLLRAVCQYNSLHL